MPETRSRSLTGRLALWIAAIFCASIVLFAAIVYVVVFIEESGEMGRESRETPAEIASDTQAQVLEALAVALPFGLVMSVGGAVWIARRAMRPMNEVIRIATEITETRLDRRLPIAGADDELARLVVALNALLARLERGFAAQARFAADASHELRTPLAVVAGQLEVALRRPRGELEWAETATAVLDDVRRLIRLTDALLRLRRAEVVAPAPEAAVELSSVVEAVASRAGAELLIGDIPPVEVRGDIDELAAAVGNVVANAAKVTPSGKAIRMWAERDGEKVRLHVADEGPGIRAADRERIFLAFSRGDESDGFGLGLPIARAIAEAVGGHLSVEPSTHGAHFAFAFPLARR